MPAVCILYSHRLLFLFKLTRFVCCAFGGQSPSRFDGEEVTMPPFSPVVVDFDSTEEFFESTNSEDIESLCRDRCWFWD